MEEIMQDVSVPEELDIEVIDDIPEADRNKEPITVNPEPDEAELRSYSDNVRKRIGTLQRAYHDERRAKEQAQREQSEALNYANSLIEKNKNLVQRTNTDATLLHETYKSKVESDLERAKRAYKDAYESGDADAVTNAQDGLNRASMRHEMSITQQPALQTIESDVKTPDSVYTAPPPDEKAVSWAKQNAWFGKDRLMTSLVYGVHEELIANGVHPVRDAEKYYDEINKSMRQRFPDYGWADNAGKDSRPRAANVVAPVTRATTGNKIRLTQTQVAIAKRLNVSLSDYAKQVAVLNGGSNG